MAESQGSLKCKRTNTPGIEFKMSKQVLEGYFTGPRDISRHSKWPRALRMHGSVTPKLAIPLICVACWSTLITAISVEVHNITVHPIVLTVLGLVVGLALNFRSNSAYERYMDGRKVWSSLGAVSTSLARVIWLHVSEREGQLGKADLIDKINALNMINAFAIALKHKLRFEPYTQYEDLQDMVAHLDTFARAAGAPARKERVSACKKVVGDMLRIPMARSNPRKELKHAKQPLGNMPLEILTFLSAYVHETIENGTFSLGIAQMHTLNAMRDMHSILATADRVLNTPLPIAYTITIHQITWTYIITLPFQLVGLTRWMTIPVTLFTAYIILAILGTGNEIENPFGTEVNELPMEMYCTQITSEVNLIASTPARKLVEQFRDRTSKPLFPISTATADFWAGCSEREIREALKMRATVSKGTMWERQQSVASEDDTVFEPSDEEKGTRLRKKSFWFTGSDNAAYPSGSYD